MHKQISIFRIFFVISLYLILSAAAKAQLTANPTANPSTTCAGDNVQLDAGATGGSGPLIYFWSSSPIGFTSTDAAPTDNPSVTTTYSVNVFDIFSSESVNGQVTVTVNPRVTVGITINASANSVCAGTSVTFTAIPTNGGASPTYQWKVNGSNSGSNSATFSYAPSDDDDVQCVLTSSLDCVTNSQATSNTINMTVNTPLIPSVSISASSNPVCAGASVTFTATPVNGGPSPTYQWRVNGSNSGSNSATFSYTPSNNDDVQCVLTSSLDCVTNNPATSNTVRMTINSPLTPSVSISASSNPVCAGTSVTFTATPVNGGSPSYQWRVNGSNAGTNSSTFTSSSLNNNDIVTVVMTSSLDCLTANTATSNSVTLTVNALPSASLTSSDADNTFCLGTSITFTASGGTSFNFRVNETSVQNGAGNTYTTSTLTNGQVVSVTVTNSGCSAVASITNNVNPRPSATLTSSDADNSFCTGTSITFTASGGNDYDFRVGTTSVQHNSSATYTTTSLANGEVVSVIVTNSNGCSATSAGITNSVHPVPVPILSSSDPDNTFCAGTSITFTASGGNSYDFRIGGNRVQNGTSPTYTTSSISNGQVVDVIVTTTTGCSATSAGITNTVLPQPSANAGAGGNTCSLIFNLNAVPSNGTGTWRRTAGTGAASFSPNDHAANAVVTVTEYGTYTFSWTEVNGQCSSTSPVTVNFYLQPVANAGIGGNNCGLVFHLNGVMNAGTGTWSRVSGPGTATFSPNANTPTATVTVSAFGTYTFSWVVTNGTCSNNSSVTVIFIQQLAAAGGTGGSVCGKEFALKATPVVSGTSTWAKITGPGAAVFSPDNHQPGATVTVDLAGTYDFTWTIDNGVCSSSDVVRVVFRAPPLVSAGIDTATCSGSKIQLQASGSGSVIWAPAALLNNPALINPVASPVNTTTFTITLTDQFGCKNSDDVIVEVREKTVADAGPDQELGSILTTNLDARLAYSYEHGIWTLAEGVGEIQDSTDAKTKVTQLGKGTNKFLWTVTNRVCAISTDTTNIIVNDFVIPTMITPNMDGRNDYFIVKGLSALVKTEVVIFDRRGVQVYKNLNYDNSWNGVDYNDKPLANDTYYYVIKTSNGISVSGFIVIRR